MTTSEARKWIQKFDQTIGTSNEPLYVFHKSSQAPHILNMTFKEPVNNTNSYHALRISFFRKEKSRDVIYMATDSQKQTLGFSSFNDLISFMMIGCSNNNPATYLNDYQPPSYFNNRNYNQDYGGKPADKQPRYTSLPLNPNKVGKRGNNKPTPKSTYFKKPHQSNQDNDKTDNQKKEPWWCNF